MKDLLYSLAPSATQMIRADHAQALAGFHRFRPGTSLRLKQGLVDSICLALELHAQLEEEIFYPALRAETDETVLKDSVPEHEAMRRLIGELRGMDPAYPRYDDLFMELMRTVLHHVADEETIVLPLAERVLRSRLGELGLQMKARRLQLMAPRAPDLAANLARATPVPSAVLALLAVAGGVWLGWRWAKGQEPLPREALRRLRLR